MKNSLLIIALLAYLASASQPAASDAVFHKITREYTWHKDGSMEYHYYKKLKLLTHLAFNRLYGETFIVYNPDFQKLKVNFCRTTHEDEKITEAPFNAFNEVLPGFAARAPRYNNLREMVVTHPGTEINAILELDYTIVTKPGFYPGLMADELLTETSPVEEEEIILRVPNGQPLRFRVFHSRTAPEINREGDYTVYRFLFRNITENSHESFQPAHGSHLPRLIFSTLTWTEALRQVFQDHAAGYKVNEAMQAMITRLKSESTYDIPFVLSLNKTIADETNHFPIPWNLTGFTWQDPLATWQQNGGTEIETAMLFIALLREAGIHAEPAFVVPEALFTDSIGCLPQIEQILVQVNPREHEQMYLKTTGSNNQNKVYGLNHRVLIYPAGDGFVYSPLHEKFENKVITNGTIFLDTSMKASGTLEIALTEEVNPHYTITLDSGYVKTLLQGLPSKDIVSSSVINSAQFRTLADLKFASREPLTELSGYFSWEFPVNKQGLQSWHMNYLTREREDPLELPFVVNEQYSYEINLPEGMRLVNPVDLIEMKTSFGELVLSTRQQDLKILVKRMFLVNKQVIEPEEYSGFKSMLDLWNDRNYRKIIIKKQ